MLMVARTLPPVRTYSSAEAPPKQYPSVTRAPGSISGCRAATSCAAATRAIHRGRSLTMPPISGPISASVPGVSRSPHTSAAKTANPRVASRRAMSTMSSLRPKASCTRTTPGRPAAPSGAQSMPIMRVSSWTYSMSRTLSWTMVAFLLERLR